MLALKSMLLMVLTSAWLVTSAMAHPFHTSVAELDWNEATGRWEVSIRMHAGDLELALANQFGKQIDIESSTAQSFIQQYIDARFEILPQDDVEAILKVRSSRSSKTAAAKDSQQTDDKPLGKIDWLGQELEGNWLWLYFELQPTTERQPLVLLSQLLTEVNDDQINIVSVRKDGKRTSRQTNRNQQWISLPK